MDAYLFLTESPILSIWSLLPPVLGGSTDISIRNMDSKYFSLWNMMGSTRYYIFIFLPFVAFENVKTIFQSKIIQKLAMVQTGT